MSCRDVCVTMDYDGSNSFSREQVRRARKPHQCVECDRPILPGATYEYAAGMTDGDFWDAHTCMVCREIRKEFCCGSWTYGQLWESIDEQLFSEWPRNDLLVIDCLAKLETDEAVAFMRQKYADYLERQS